MDFAISPEQGALVETASRFARNRLAPAYREREKAECIERELIGEMGDMGLFGVELAEAHGGLGLDCVTSGLLLEQIAYGDFNVSYVNLLVSLCGQIVATHGRSAEAREWLKNVVAGRNTIAIALTEPSAGSDAARLKLKATREGDDFLLSGEKTSISLATQADVAVVRFSLFFAPAWSRTGPGGSAPSWCPWTSPGFPAPPSTTSGPARWVGAPSSSTGCG